MLRGGIARIAGISLIMSVFTAALLCSVTELRGFTGFILLMVILTPLRCISDLLCGASSLVASPRITQVFPTLMRFLPFGSTFLLAGNLGPTVFLVSFTISRLVGLLLPLFKSSYFSWAKAALGRRPEKQSTTAGMEGTSARAQLILMAPIACFELVLLTLLATTSSELLLGYLIVVNLVNLSLFVHSRCLSIPTRALPPYSLANSRALFSRLMGRWKIITLLLFLTPVMLAALFASEYTRMLYLVSPSSLSLVLPWIVLHLAKGWHAQRVEFLLSDRAQTPRWALQLLITAPFSVVVLWYLVTSDSVSLFTSVVAQALVLTTSAVLTIGSHRPRGSAALKTSGVQSCLLVLRRPHRGVNSTGPIIAALAQELPAATQIREVIPGVLRLTYPTGLFVASELPMRCAGLVVAVIEESFELGKILSLLADPHSRSKVFPQLRRTIGALQGEIPKVLSGTHAAAVCTEALCATLQSGMPADHLFITPETILKHSSALNPEIFSRLLRHLRANNPAAPFCEVRREEAILIKVGDVRVAIVAPQTNQINSSYANYAVGVSLDFALQRECHHSQLV
jgi:hypothetical protein